MTFGFTEKLNKGSLLLIFITITLFYLSVAWEFITTSPNFNLILTILGTTSLTAGFLLRVIAHNNLKENFHYAVKINHNHTLITDNIHKYIRHPMYTGMFLLLLGIALIFSSSYGVAILILLVTPVGIYRTIVEERALTKHFGNDYVNYCYVTKRFIPYIL